ncbi:MAG TPA: pilus assembly protein TadG-related protein [Syntrophomonadaceae bacterium]|nr:pilus assembly protein TadG-related protein [Syntrophomonadaceae bacterium]HPR92806.1 pilus assembly protein TadG-related protein [Syntrophomonadaceae bacterium]
MVKLLAEEKGSVIVIVTLVLFVTLGMAALVIDSGSQYVTKSKLQNAADAAALAEAQDIAHAMVDLETQGAAAMSGITLAQAEARIDDYAVLNGLTPDNLTAADFIYLNDPSNPFNGIPVGIRVDAGQEVNFGLARIFGPASNVVTAHAEAQAGVVVSAFNAVPLSVLDGQDVNGNRVDMITNNPVNSSSTEAELQSLASGWFGYLQLSDKIGTSFLADQILNGVDTELSAGETVGGIPGLKAADLNDNSVIGTLRDQCLSECDHALCSYAGGYDEDCPRLKLVPVVDILSGSGSNTQLCILGFALCLLDPPAKYDSGWALGATYIQGVTNCATAIEVNAIGTESDYHAYGYLLTK